MALTPTELRERLHFDYEVCRAMFGPVFSGEAYRSTADLEHRNNPITSLDQGHLATKYRVDFHVRTPVARGKYENLTTIGFDLSTGSYPFSAPATWIISQHIPYSPHFRRGAPVCIGELWDEAKGTMLLGQLMVHIAKLLNWDEQARGGGYVGWNGDAIAYHREKYGNRPITPGLPYPALPVQLTHGAPPVAADLFQPMTRTAPNAALFAAAGPIVRRRP